MWRPPSFPRGRRSPRSHRPSGAGGGGAAPGPRGATDRPPELCSSSASGSPTPSTQRRKGVESWIDEPEAAFMELEEYMEFAEAMVCAVVPQVLERRGADLQVLERDLARLEAVRAPFPRLSYDEALSRLLAEGKPLPWGEDLGGDEETVISAAFERPVFGHHYPARCKAFYMQPERDRPDVVAP